MLRSLLKTFSCFCCSRGAVPDLLQPCCSRYDVPELLSYCASYRSLLFFLLACVLIFGGFWLLRLAQFFLRYVTRIFHRCLLPFLYFHRSFFFPNLCLIILSMAFSASFVNASPLLYLLVLFIGRCFFV